VGAVRDLHCQVCLPLTPSLRNGCLGAPCQNSVRTNYCAGKALEAHDALTRV